MEKTTHPFMQMLALVGISLLCMLVSSVAMGLLVDMKSYAGMMVTQVVVTVFSFLLPVIWIAYRYYRGEWRSFWKIDFSGHAWLMAGVGVVAMMLLTPLNDWLTHWNDSWDLGALGEMLRNLQRQSEALLEEMMSTDTVGGLFINLAVVALTAAVCEEAFFRVGMQGILQRWVGNPHVAIVVTAAIFSLFHMEVFAFMPRFVLGVLLGYLFHYGGSIVLNVTAHFFNNAVVVVLYWMVAHGVIDFDPAAPMNFHWSLIAGCSIAAVGVLWVSFGKKLKINK
jgi:hypothetical protein